MYDPDQFDTRAEDFKSLDKLLSKLDDCDLCAWDRDFVDDMIKRAAKLGNRCNVTALQQEQLDRMERQYGC